MSAQHETAEKREIQEFRLPGYNEIPDVGLYLKQVVKYLNETLNPWFDISVTETMISNYVKMHMIPNAIKKLYYRDQIASLLFIVLAKPVVSLDNIQILLKLRAEKYETREGYELFSSAFMRTIRSIFCAEETESAAPLDAYQALIKNIIIAIVQKYYIEKCFRDLEKTLEEEKEAAEGKA